MKIKKALSLSFALALVVVDAGLARAAASPALDCLQASAQSGGLAGCLGEPARDAAAPAVAVGPASVSTPASLTVSALRPAPNKAYRRVPTPTGYRDDEDGTVATGFFKGMDSGFKVVFAAVVAPAVAGIEASGGPYKGNAGTWVFTGLGFLLSIPASLIGALVGAPIGAVAGIVAEKAAPGSTKHWYSF